MGLGEPGLGRAASGAHTLHPFALALVKPWQSSDSSILREVYTLHCLPSGFCLVLFQHLEHSLLPLCLFILYPPHSWVKPFSSPPSEANGNQTARDFYASTSGAE